MPIRLIQNAPYTYILHIIEWIDENEEEITDEELATAMKEQGKKDAQKCFVTSSNFREV